MRVYAVGTQKIQRRHRNVGPFQGLGPAQGWLGIGGWSPRNGQEGGEAFRERVVGREWGCSGRWCPPEAVCKNEAFSHPEDLYWCGYKCWWGAHGHCDHYITSWLEIHQFDNLVSQAHQHILNAQIAGEESPGNTACTGRLPSFSPDRAETVFSKKWHTHTHTHTHME